MRQWILLFLLSLMPALYGESQYILCIDGGGSKTALQVLDQKGQVVPLTHNERQIKTYFAGSSNINTVGVEGVREVFHALFNDVFIGKKNLADLISDCSVVAGMAGIGSSRETITMLFEEQGVSRLSLMSDAELALQLVEGEGIVLISGTGSICFGKKGQDLFRVGGLGRVLGDEGSGYQIGLQALKAALAEEYGWGITTSLTPGLKEFYDVSDLKSLIRQIHSGEISPSKIASYAPFVFEKAFEKDKAAEEIIHKAANDLSNLLIEMLKISHLSNCEINLWGGVFKGARADAFIQEIVDQLPAQFKIINRSQENAAALFASKYLLITP